MIDVVTLALAKKYTKKSLIGLGALKGAPCEVESIITNGLSQTIKLKWTAANGKVEYQDVNIESGNGVVDIRIDSDCHLKFEMTDGTIIDAGELPTIGGTLVTQEEKDTWNSKQDAIEPIEITSDLISDLFG